MPARVVPPVATLTGFVTVVVAVAVGWAPLTRFDLAASQWARDYGLAHPGWVAAWSVITHAGAGALFAALSAALTAALLLRRRYVECVFVVGAVLATELTRYALLFTVTRERPAGGFAGYFGYAFPSGHTLRATTMALVGVLLLWPRLGRRGRAVAVAVVVAWPGLVGVSRVLLVVHWPSDVVASWLIVFGIVPLVARLTRRAAAPPPGPGSPPAPGCAAPASPGSG